MLANLVMDPATSERLVWTLVHFVWEGFALAIGFRLLLAWLRRRAAKPQTRYAAGCCCLLLMATTVAGTFVCLAGSFDDPGPLTLPPSVHARPPSGPSAVLPTIVHARLRSALKPAAPAIVWTWAGAVTLLGLVHSGRLLLLQHAVRATSDELPADWQSLRE